MKQDDVLKVHIRDVGYAGEGIAKAGEYTVFVPFALPREEVEVKVNHVKKNLAYATLTRVIEPAPERVKPVCPKYGKCGGCDLMHAAYDYQLAVKRDLVATTLAKAGVTADVARTVPSPKTLGYRNKIALPFGVVEGKTALGFYREGTHKVVRISRCPLHEEWAEKIIAATLQYAETYGLTVYDGEKRVGLLRHLVARKMGEHIDVVLVVNGRSLPHWTEYVNALSAVWQDFCLYVSPNLRHNNVIMGDEIYLRWGEPYAHTVEGIRVAVNPLSFLQVNDEICAEIYQAVRRAVEPKKGKTVVDAFAGVGALGASFAKAGADVYNIEIVPEAVEDADRVARENGVEEHNLLGDSAVLLPQVLDEIRKKTPRVHDMHLQKPYWDAIAEGRKKYELRLADEKRKAVAVGDLVRFDADGRQLYCRVTEKREFASFGELFAALGTAETCGEDMSAEEAAASMATIYSEEKQAAHGAVALKVEPVNAEGISVVLDPPRKGCPASVVDALVELAEQGGREKPLCDERWDWVTLPYVERVVYVSCNPATLARDLASLQTAYAIDEVRPYDMFPQTRHIETLVQLSHKIPDSHIVVKVDFDKDNSIQTDTLLKNAQVYKPAERVTYKMIQAYVEENYGFKVHTAYIAEVKRSYGLPMYDAPNAVEELKRPRQHPSEKMIEAIKDALKHFEII